MMFFYNVKLLVAVSSRGKITTDLKAGSHSIKLCS